MVLDLIHPSLFCVIADRTLVVDDEVITIDNALMLMGKGSLLDAESFRRRYEHIPAITVHGNQNQVQPEQIEYEDDDNEEDDNDNEDEDKDKDGANNDIDNIDNMPSNKRARIEKVITPQTNTVHILLRTTDESPYVYIMYGELPESTKIEEVEQYISNGSFMCNNPHVTVRDQVIHHYYQQDYARNIPLDRIILRSQYNQRLRHNKTLADYDYNNGHLITNNI